MKIFKCYKCEKINIEYEDKIDFIICSNCSGIYKRPIYMEEIKERK